MNQDEKLQKLRDQTVGDLQSLFNNREPTLTRLPGILGKTNDKGDATVTGRPKWVYVRVGNDETLTTAFNNRTGHRNGLPVVVGYDPAQPLLFQVLQLRNVYEDTEDIGGSAVGRHHATHEWGQTDGDDIVYLRIRQLHDLRVYVNDPADLSVNVSDGIYIIGETAYYLAPEAVDLTSSVPGAGLMRWVLIAVNDSGVYTTNGSTGVTVALTDIPAPAEPTDWRLAAVLLKGGDTEITDWPDEVRVVDLRFAGSRSSSATGGYISWANAVVVATEGGTYALIQDGVNAADTDTHVIILNGAYTENVSFSGSYITVFSLVDAHYSGPFGVYLVGADDTGPILEISGPSIWGGLVVNRELSGGAGDFTGVDASSGSYKYFSDMRIDIGGGATGRNVFSMKLGAAAGNTSALSRSHVRGSSVSSGTILQLSGDGDIEVELSAIINSDGLGNPALIIANTGTTSLYQCRIEGDISVTGAGTHILRNCKIEGDVVLAASGATVKLINCDVGGDITVGASDILLLGPGTTQATGKSISNSGTILPLDYKDHTSGSHVDHFLGPMGDGEASYINANPVGSVSGANRASFRAFFTDYLDDATNYERVELVAYDNGSTVAGMVRTLAGGSGTARALYLGVGDTPADMTVVNTSNQWTFPQNARFDGNVGIGQAPSARLDIIDTSSVMFRLTGSGSSIGALASFINSDGDEWRFGIGGGVNRFDIREDNNVQFVVDEGGLVGIQVNSPQGTTIHGHDGLSGFMHWSYDGVDGTTRTIHTNATGDVTLGVFGLVYIEDSGGNAAKNFLTLENSDTQDFTIDSTTYRFTVAANGAFSVARTAGATTGKIVVFFIWM